MQRIAVGPSMLLALVLCAGHVAAGGVLWLVPLPAAAQVVGTLAIALSLVYSVTRDAALRAPSSIVALEYRENGDIACRTRGGEWLECELLGSSYVSERLTVVGLRPRARGGALRAVLVRDNVDPGDFRKLRAWLRWRTPSVNSVTQP